MNSACGVLHVPVFRCKSRSFSGSFLLALRTGINAGWRVGYNPAWS